MSLLYFKKKKIWRKKDIKKAIIHMHIVYTIFLVMTSIATADDYYVATWGNNYNRGTIESPWKTIDYAADEIAPGDTAWIIDGTYTNDFLTISSSGTPDNPKNIKKYNGTVIIDGKDATGNGISMNGMSYWNIQGIDIKNVKCPVYWSGNNTHHINLSDCEISYFITPITFNNGAHDITLYNVKIHTLFSGSGNHLNIFGGKDDNSLVTKNISIINCNIYNNYMHNGINFGPATGGGDSSWYNKYIIDGILIKNTRVHNIHGHAVTCNYITVNNLSFIDNIIYNSSKGIRVTVIDSILRGNEVYGIRDGNPMALQFENGISRNVLFDRNYIHDNIGAEGYYAIEIRKVHNATISNLVQHGMAGLVRNCGGSFSERTVEDIYMDKYNIKMDPGPSGISIEYTNGDVFELTGLETIVDPIYFPSKSRAYITTSDTGVITARHYNMTVQPQEIITDVTINKFNLFTDTYRWTVESSKKENPTWFTITVKESYSNYIINRDGLYYITVYSDGDKKARFFYAKYGNEWDIPHSFHMEYLNNEATGHIHPVNISDTRLVNIVSNDEKKNNFIEMGHISSINQFIVT